MDVVAQNKNNTTIMSILPTKKLSGSNLTNWYRNLRIVLKYEKKKKFVEQPTGPALDPETADPNIIDKYYETVNLNMGKTIAELHAMLKLHEKGAKGKDNGKNKLAYAPKPKIPPSPKRDNPANDSVYHHLKEGLKESKKLKHGALSLYTGNEMRATVEAIGSFDLILSNGLIIVLDNYHFAPSVTRGVVSIFCLVNNGYIHTFTNYGIYVLKNNVFYFNAIPRDGIYEIDMHNLYPNVSSMFNVSNKREKHVLDSSYLWHCRLVHINKKRMDKLQREGILQPTHDESLKKCKSCIFEMMACKPFSHQVERAKDLLGLIHTGVCGLFRMVLREGASYLITFTDDFSRYGYVYLMKHKHEVFETSKIFHNEVENQLGKKIKVTRSDRGEDLNEPPNYKAALLDPEFDKWLEAMNTKLQSIKDNQVWVLVDIPPNGRSVWSKWIFKKKTDMDGNVHTFKARLIGKGYTQTYGVYYGKTFSLVVDIRVIRILLAIATFYDYEI
nr:hypothetical protein [Tanacetum cinerariifolium]